MKKVTFKYEKVDIFVKMLAYLGTEQKAQFKHRHQIRFTGSCYHFVHFLKKKIFFKKSILGNKGTPFFIVSKQILKEHVNFIRALLPALLSFSST